jgi:hypothetical protein
MLLISRLDAERTPLSMVIIADLDSVEGEALLQEAVTFVSVSKLCNVCF